MFQHRNALYKMSSVIYCYAVFITGGLCCKSKTQLPVIFRRKVHVCTCKHRTCHCKRTLFRDNIIFEAAKPGNSFPATHFKFATTKTACRFCSFQTCSNYLVAQITCHVCCYAVADIEHCTGGRRRKKQKERRRKKLKAVFFCFFFAAKLILPLQNCLPFLQRLRCRCQKYICS